MWSSPHVHTTLALVDPVPKYMYISQNLEKEKHSQLHVFNVTRGKYIVAIFVSQGQETNMAHIVSSLC